MMRGSSSDIIIALSETCDALGTLEASAMNWLSIDVDAAHGVVNLRSTPSASGRNTGRCV